MPTPSSPLPISNNFHAKRFCLQSLLLAGLLLFSGTAQAADDDNSNDDNNNGGPIVKTEPLMLGSPTRSTTCTRTTTITIAYKPTLAPGDDTYTLFGCYGEASEEGGLPFHQHEAPAGISGDKLTLDACLKGCAALKPPTKDFEQYAYAGTKNGR